MTAFSRFAVYYLPDGPLAAFGAAWLGWDAGQGVTVPQWGVPGLADWTATPRKYGFHATLKPPMRLAPGAALAGLTRAVAELAAREPPVTVPALVIRAQGRFVALVPAAPCAPLSALAAACVTELDAFRAPAPPEEIARRRAKGLTPAQDAHLVRWGYPYVLDQFGFHMTLTGSLDEATRERARAAAEARLPRLPAPFGIDRIAIAGEGADGMFRALSYHALTGPAVTSR